jgi:DNA-binding transcriptional LysR family regulator
MNVLHLELLYYVARHGGIMPTVSAEVAQLEEFLGAPLFHRRGLR